MRLDTSDMYIDILYKFINLKITGVQFEEEFLQLWRSDRDGDNEHNILIDEIFLDVDCFCSCSEGCDDRFDIDEDELRKRCAVVLDLLVYEYQV